MHFNDILRKLVSGHSLSSDEVSHAMESMMEGKWSPVCIAAFLSAFAAKGETPLEIAACVNIMRQKAIAVPVNNPMALDTCGTGGDGLHTVNISTLSAMVLASGGVPVVKHGNKSVSNQCGSADILEAMGINIHLTAAQAIQVFNNTGITFLFAPLFHPAMKAVMPVRKELGIRTVFNILGPLANPAAVKRQIVGVFSPDLLRLYSEVMQKLPIERAYIVHGSDGMDEVTVQGETRINMIHENEGIQGFNVQPADFGLKEHPLASLKGGDAAANRQLAEEFIGGKENAVMDAVCMNASLGFMLSETVNTFKEGAELSRSLVREGKVSDLVQQWKKNSHF